jgi:hypothetical protein
MSKIDSHNCVNNPSISFCQSDVSMGLNVVTIFSERSLDPWRHSWKPQMWCQTVLHKKMGGRVRKAKETQKFCSKEIATKSGTVFAIEMKGITTCKLTIISESAFRKKFLGQIWSYAASL